ncbi:CpaD family pilus assembly lipoprotein [Emcibacter sp.]|uniref:CpaD family pilus assembly lipoprotein n=1 Tax=Emcibacter sp. TaxID=1979954 RepID=UPI002AA800A8|nr:CpaD family pilus assembly lipoprotein [Emcibacter sp.]
MMKKNILKLIAITSLLMTAGCAGLHEETGLENLKRNKVEMVRLPYMMTFTPDTHRLDRDQVKALIAFLGNSSVGYGDELSMDFPLEKDGNLSDLNKKRLSFITELLKQHGIIMAAEVTPYGVAPKPDQARLLVSRYVVTPPRCGDWSRNSAANYNNAPMMDFGCTTQANLGLMVANPRDLITGNRSASPQAEKAAKAVSTYVGGGKKESGSNSKATK